MKVPKRPVIRTYIDHVSDHIVDRRYSFLRSERIWRFAGEPLFEHCSNPRRPITEGFNLFVLDKDGVAANPVIAANRAVQEFRIAHPTEVGLGVGQQWSFREVL